MAGVNDEDVRLAVYHSFATTGAVPAYGGLADVLGLNANDVRAALRRLDVERHVVLDADDNVVMAHPFASIPLGFSVMGEQTLWWGGCCWDSFAIPHLVVADPEVLVATRCPGCTRALSWVVGREAPPEGEELAHFLTSTAHIWDDVVRSCGNQRLFCSHECIQAWLLRTGHEQGYVMDLATLWRLSRGWYAGRLQRGYRRREPVASAAYFREVGLKGPFWGL
jgi:Alkylmercury lyase